MGIDEWHSRLADTFTVNGLVGGHLVEVHDRERDIGDHLVTTFRGQNELIDSFQSYYVETLNLAIDLVVRQGWLPHPSSYALALAQFLSLFRRYRACELLFYSGYPLDGYSLLRDVKDRAVMLAGVAHNMTTLTKIMGTEPPMEDKVQWRKRVIRNRKNEEQRISKRIYGDDSGLRSEITGELRFWDNLFHEEVHGGQLSLIHEVELLTKGMANRAGPTFHQQAFAVYMNRSAELGWLILRLMPYLQMSENAFGDDWHRKHSVLDDSFRFMVQGLTTLGKKIGEAFICLVDEKFIFRQPFHYFEADGCLRRAASHPHAPGASSSTRKMAPTVIRSRTAIRLCSRREALCVLIGSYSGRRRRSRWPPTLVRAPGPAWRLRRRSPAASERSIMAQTGHRSSAMVRRYIRDSSLFRENAAAKVGL
jgi:hypothetical protein